MCEPIFEKPLKDISFGQVLMRLFQTARRFNMEVQPQLVLLQKTLLNIEGLGRQLYPDLDLWSTAKPFLERWMNEQVGWRGFVENLKREAPRYVQLIPELPRLMHAARLSFGLALLAAITAAVPGVLLGIAASWRGAGVERALVMLSDVVLSVPGLLLVLLFAALVPGRGDAL